MSPVVIATFLAGICANTFARLAQIIFNSYTANCTDWDNGVVIADVPSDQSQMSSPILYKYPIHPGMTYHRVFSFVITQFTVHQASAPSLDLLLSAACFSAFQADYQLSR